MILIGVLIAFFGMALSEHKKWKKKKKLEVEDLEENLQAYQLAVQSITRCAKTVKKQLKQIKKKKKTESLEDKPRAYVLDFKGDIEASQVRFLREEISILLKTADPKKGRNHCQTEQPRRACPQPRPGSQPA